MEVCHNNLGRNKFSDTDILNKESEVLEAAGWMISPKPTLYEAFEMIVTFIEAETTSTD